MATTLSRMNMCHNYLKQKQAWWEYVKKFEIKSWPNHWVNFSTSLAVPVLLARDSGAMTVQSFVMSSALIKKSGVALKQCFCSKEECEVNKYINSSSVKWIFPNGISVKYFLHLFIIYITQHFVETQITNKTFICGSKQRLKYSISKICPLFTLARAIIHSVEGSC